MIFVLIAQKVVNACFTFGSTSSTCDVNLNCEEEHSSEAKQKNLRTSVCSQEEAQVQHITMFFRATPGVVLSMCALQTKIG
jgi:hypothetical protein